MTRIRIGSPAWQALSKEEKVSEYTSRLETSWDREPKAPRVPHPALQPLAEISQENARHALRNLPCIQDT